MGGVPLQKRFKLVESGKQHKQNPLTLWAKLCPITPKTVLKSFFLPVNVNLYENKVFAEVIKLRWSLWINTCSNPTTGRFVRGKFKLRDPEKARR